MKKSLFVALTLLLSMFAGQVSANIKQTRIYAEDCTVSPGEQFRIPIKYDGNVSVSVAVFSVTIPEGFSFPNSKAAKNIELAEAFTDLDFSVSANILNGNELRVTIEDPEQLGVDAESGLLANVLVKVADNTASGPYTFKLGMISASDADAGNYKTPDQNFTVTVLNKYTVTATSANTEYGTVALTPEAENNIYVENTEVTATATAAEGYHFVKWSDEATDNPYTFTVTADTELTATFAPNQYTMTFVLGNGEENVVKTQDYKSELTAPTPTRTGYTFAGWDEEVPATVPLGDKTFTAQWTLVEYPITYNLVGGTAEGNPDKYTVETETFTLVNPTMTGYTFAGWTEIYSGEDRGLTVTIEKGSTGRLFFQARWTVNQYTITFDTDGGSEVAAITQDYNTAVTAPADPTKTGYTFAGWDPALPETIPAENVTVKAKWTIVNYTISYDLNGGQWPATVAAPTTFNVESNAIEIPTPERPYYEFRGWTSADVVEPAIPWIIAQGTTGDLALKAEWVISTGINAVMVKGQKADVYTIDGRLVKRGMTTEEAQQLPRGLYIVNGKKVAVK